MNEHSCSQCGSCFTRHEHLARHARTHTKEKPHVCCQCGKSFARLDALRRHTAAHSARSPTASSRACRQCAMSRVRCSKGKPCKRCFERSTVCEYPPSRTRGDVAPSSLHFSDVNVGALDTPNTTSADTNIFPISPLYGQYDVSWDVSLDMSHVQHIEFVACGAEQPLTMSAMNWLPPAAPVVMDLNNTTLQADMAGQTPINGQRFATGRPAMNETAGSCDQEAWEVSGKVDETFLLQSHDGDDPDNSSDGPDMEDSSPAPFSPDSVATGKATLYIDGAPTRLPFKGRSLDDVGADFDHGADPRPIAKQLELDSSDTSPASDPTEGTSPANKDGGGVLDSYLSANAFSNLTHRLQSLSILENDDVSEGSLPTISHIRAFFRLYFRRFHEAWPYLPPILAYYEEPSRWLLLLGVVAVGSKYALGQQCSIYSGLLCHLLAESAPRIVKDAQQRMSTRTAESASQEGDDLAALQAGILDTVCKVHDANMVSRREGFSLMFLLVDICRDMGLLEVSSTLNTDVPPDAALRDWFGRQTQIRTGLMIWVLDSVMATEYSRRPLCCLDDASGSLPCNAIMWAKPSYEDLISSARHSVTLPKALQVLYLEKGLPPNLDDLGTVVLIIAILRRTQEAFDQYRTPLASWSPSAHVQNWTSSTLPLRQEEWPPRIPILSKWRNSACDCLDILHWNANGTIARAGGWEHPAVFNLHLSRLLILTPRQDLLCVATLNPSQTDDVRTAHRRVSEWAFNDQHKARLSVVHAGALLWHVRRYRVGSFLEPFGVFMATLVLWAYSSALRLLSHQQNQNTGNHEIPGKVAEDNLDPLFLHLDRPLDDELVQDFVMSGFSMAGYISGVGNIQQADAPARVLAMGVRLLANLEPGGKLGQKASSASGVDEERSDVWGVESMYMERLERLKESVTSG